jgi:arylsulfatase A-like enzyme
MRLLNVILAIAIVSCRHAEKGPTRPNIILIVTDDHSKNAVSCYGSKLIKTPHIDRLAAEGVKFENAFVTNALCGPSRAVILTGKYSHINGFRDNNDTFNGAQVTFPKLLRDAGYYTAIVGKWHLSSKPQYFDYWNILIGQGRYYNPDFIEMGDTSKREGYVTDIITDLAIAQIDKRPSNKPFCLLLHQKAPHRNWMPDLKHLGRFDSISFPLPATFNDDYSTRSRAAGEADMRIRDMFYSYDLKLKLPQGLSDPGSGGHAVGDGAKFWKDDYDRFTDQQRQTWDDHYRRVSDSFFKADLKGRELENWMYQLYIRDYLACVQSVDENIGRLLKYLEEKKLLENTLIVYTSDQGFFLGEHGWYDKRFMYEESLSMPFILRYPKKIGAGSINKDLVLNLDLAPTLLAAAGLEVPVDMQGSSIWPRITGGKPSTDNVPWRKGIYYHYYEYPYGAHKVKKHYGIRTQRYKLIHFYNDIDAWELYDLKTDPNEIRNLYALPEFKNLADSLKKELSTLRQLYLDTARLETH